jgi:hypothetical protein
MSAADAAASIMLDVRKTVMRLRLAYIEQDATSKIL